MKIKVRIFLNKRNKIFQFISH